MSKNRFHGIDPYIVKLVAFKANQLCMRPEFTDADREDLEQELVLDVLQRISEYDSTKAKQSTFAAHIINNKAATILARCRALKRNHNRIEYSLNDIIEDKEGVLWERDELFDRDIFLINIGRQSRPSQELIDMRIDVQNYINSLPPQHQDICKMLMRKTITSTAQSMGTPRTTTYGIISKIRKELKRSGLDDYI